MSYDNLKIDPSSLDINFKGAFLLGRCSGVSGVVQTCRHTSSHSKPQSSSSVILALKRYNLDKVRRSDDEISETNEFNELAKFIQHEVSSMRQLRHPNLMPCLASFVSGFEIFLVLPIFSLRSVKDILDECFREGLPELAIAAILKDVLKALHHLHSQGIVHRSVRASHILLDKSGKCVLSGLRYSCSLIEVGQGIQDRYDFPLYVAKTNLNWLSPEFLSQNLLGYNEKSDIYSLGVTACEMANGIVPFSEMPGTLMLLEKLRGATPKLLDSSTFEPMSPEELQEAEEEAHQEQLHRNPDQAIHFAVAQAGDSGVGASVESYGVTVCSSSSRNTFQELKKRDAIYSGRSFSTSFHNLVTECSALDATLRPTASQLMNHPFLKQVKKSGGSNFFLPAFLKEMSTSMLLDYDENVDRQLSDLLHSQLQLIVDDEERYQEDIDWQF